MPLFAGPPGRVRKARVVGLELLISDPPPQAEFGRSARGIEFWALLVCPGGRTYCQPTEPFPANEGRRMSEHDPTRSQPIETEAVLVRPVLWDEGSRNVSLLAMVTDIVRNWRLVVVVPVLLCLLMAIVLIVLPARYTASTTFLPQTDQSQLSNLAGLAAQFGVTIPPSAAGESPAFYASLLQSDALLRSVAQHEFVFRVRSGADSVQRSGTLVELLHAHGSDPNRRLADALKRLRDRMDINTDPESGTIQLSVWTHWPELSVEVTDQMIDLVNRFNIESRQTQASAQRRFLQHRLADARSSLEAVEDSLQRFLEGNRSYQNSPQLTFQYDRLQRHVTLQQSVVESLAQSFEQAKLDEVRDTPVITVVSAAEMPLRPDRRHAVLVLIGAAILGVVVALAIGLGREALRRARQGNGRDYAELEDSIQLMRRDIQRTLIAIRARLRRSP